MKYIMLSIILIAISFNLSANLFDQERLHVSLNAGLTFGFGTFAHVGFKTLNELPVFLGGDVGYMIVGACPQEIISYGLKLTAYITPQFLIGISGTLFHYDTGLDIRDFTLNPFIARQRENWIFGVKSYGTNLTPLGIPFLYLGYRF